MNFDEYQALARRTQNEKLLLQQRKEHAPCGLASEVGEICGIYQKSHQGHPASVEALADEIGDLLWFAAELCDVLRLSMEDVVQRNIEKLRRRYPEGLEEERGLHREEPEAPEGGKGLAVKCYYDCHDCAHFDPATNRCGKHDRPCEEIHVDAEVEDE